MLVAKFLFAILLLIPIIVLTIYFINRLVGDYTADLKEKKRTQLLLSSNLVIPPGIEPMLPP